MVHWHPVNWGRIVAFTVFWEILYHAAKTFFARSCSHNPKMVEHGASYMVALVNACVCVFFGCWLVLMLHGSDEYACALADVNENVDVVMPVVTVAVQSFVAWLLIDGMHTAVHFPALGGVDTLLHHVGFIALPLIGYGLRVLPFLVGWLLLGEISSLFINVRWFLINSARGETKALAIANYAFAGTFFIFRIVVFWAGLAHLLQRSRPLLLDSPFHAPSWALNIICAFVAGAAQLNVFWMFKIVKMIIRNARGKPGSE